MHRPLFTHLAEVCIAVDTGQGARAALEGLADAVQAQPKDALDGKRGLFSSMLMASVVASPEPGALQTAIDLGLVAPRAQGASIAHSHLLFVRPPQMAALVGLVAHDMDIVAADPGCPVAWTYHHWCAHHAALRAFLAAFGVHAVDWGVPGTKAPFTVSPRPKDWQARAVAALQAHQDALLAEDTAA